MDEYDDVFTQLVERTIFFQNILLSKMLLNETLPASAESSTNRDLLDIDAEPKQ